MPRRNGSPNPDKFSRSSNLDDNFGNMGRCPVDHSSLATDAERERVDKPAIDFKAATAELGKLAAGISVDRRLEMLELDKLRPAISNHLVSPLIHATVVRAINKARENGILDFFAEQSGCLTSKQLSGQFNPDGFNPSEDADVLIGFISNFYMEFLRRFTPKVSDTLTEEQSVVISRFYSFGSSYDKDMAMIRASLTIMDNMQEIEYRHPELGLRSVSRMVQFLRSEEAPSIFRGIASGANGFPDSMRGLNGDIAGAPWRANLNKDYVVEGEGGKLRVNPEILKAAREHRQETARQTQAMWPQTGLREIASRYSIGCPARKLGFNPKDEGLVWLGLQLTDEQTHLLTQGDNPTATIEGDVGRIQRDSMRAVCDLVADILEVVVDAGVTQETRAESELPKTREHPVSTH